MSNGTNTIETPSDLERIFEEIDDDAITPSFLEDLLNKQARKIRDRIKDMDSDIRKVAEINRWLEVDKRLASGFMRQFCDLFDESVGPMSISGEMSKLRRVVVTHGGMSSRTLFKDLYNCLNRKISDIDFCGFTFRGLLGGYPEEDKSETDLARRERLHNEAIIEWWLNLCRDMDLDLLDEVTLENGLRIKKCCFDRWLFFVHLRDCLQIILKRLLSELRRRMAEYEREPNRAEDIQDIREVLDTVGIHL